MTSSSTLWATASKDWVIPAKPKPGRKPKKDATVAIKLDEGDEVDSKGRRVQNRAAQRAFRERKQSQLAELQARVQSYEQGEIERNVALQNIAKRLKEENEALRTDNKKLKERVSALEAKERPKRRWRDNSPTSSVSSSSDPPVKKKARPTAPPHSFPEYSSASPDSLASSSDSHDTRFSPYPFDASVEPAMSVIQPPSKQGDSLFSSFDCGYCNETTPCLCREIISHQLPLKSETFDGQPISPVQRYVAPRPQNPVSILDNLPAYQPAVPLRRRPATYPTKPVFHISQPASTPSCTGNPNDCRACAGDILNQAFCKAIGESVSSCSDCPTRNSPTNTKQKASGCCGDRSKCGSKFSTHSANPETVPTDKAWKKLQSHPNFEFTDLALLADVVARRSKCTGPRVIISPPPGSEVTTTVEPATVAASDAAQGVVLTDPHAQYRANERSRRDSAPQLVPEDILIECGRQRVREVRADGVRDALRILDSKFSLM